MKLWVSGLLRLLVVVLVIAGVVGVVVVARHHPAPSAAERAAASRAALVKLRREQARLRVAQSHDPAIRHERARLRVEQAPHFARGRPGFRSRSAQDRLVSALERSITADANHRFRQGEFDKPTLETQCQHLVRPEVHNPPPPPLASTNAGYECTAATVKFKTTVSRTGTAILGFPFWARVNFRTGRYAWCKINLLPSEHGIGDSLASVPLAPVCDVLRGAGPA